MILANYRHSNFSWRHTTEMSNLCAAGCGPCWSQTVTAVSRYYTERCRRTPAARLLHRQAADCWTQRLCRTTSIVWCCYDQAQVHSWHLISVLFSHITFYVFFVVLFDYRHHATVTSFAELYIYAVCINTNLYDITIYFIVHKTAPIPLQLFIIPLTFDTWSCLWGLLNVGVLLAAHCLCCTAGFKRFCCIKY